MHDCPLRSDWSSPSPCLQLLPVLSLATLILGVAQSVQANDGSITFELAQATTSPAETLTVSPEGQPQAIAPPSPTKMTSPGEGRNRAIAVQSSSGDLSFDLPPSTTARVAVPEATAQPVAAQPSSLGEVQVSPASLFEGGNRSLVAKAVGSAEGTRTPDGHKTPAYYGHVDPGNRVWNLGSFSYQHGADSPEAADRKQLARLQAQAQILRQQAQAQGLKLTLEEELNGIDLANQAPQAALDRGGYIDWLVEAKKLGKQGSEAVTWARARSFLDPDTGRWNAPGLGNDTERIFHDQERRRFAVAQAIAAHQPVVVADNLERLIQVEQGAQSTPPDSEVVTQKPRVSGEPNALNFKSVSNESTLAQAESEPAAPVQDKAEKTQPQEQSERSPQPEASSGANSPRMIPSWGEQNPQPAAATPGPSPFSKLSAQVFKLRSSVNPVERMRSLIPRPPVAPPAVERSSPTPEIPPLVPESPGLPSSPSGLEPSAPQTRVQQLVQQNRQQALPAPPLPQPIRPRPEIADQIISIDLSNPPVSSQEEVAAPPRF